MRVLEPDTTLTDEQLYARARGLGLDRTDLVVRRHPGAEDAAARRAHRRATRRPTTSCARSTSARRGIPHAGARDALAGLPERRIARSAPGRSLAALRDDGVARRRGGAPRRHLRGARLSAEPGAGRSARRSARDSPEARGRAPAGTGRGPSHRRTACTWSGSTRASRARRRRSTTCAGECGSAGSTSSATRRLGRHAAHASRTLDPPRRVGRVARSGTLVTRALRPAIVARDHARRVCRARPRPRSGHAVAACGGRRHVRGDLANRRCTSARQLTSVPSCRRAAARCRQVHRRRRLEHVTLRWTVDCGPDDLTGETFTVQDLDAARINALLRIEEPGRPTVQVVLNPRHGSFTVPARPSRLDVARSYVALGIEHILTGPDHLLFVFGLLLLLATTTGCWCGPSPPSPSATASRCRPRRWG